MQGHGAKARSGHGNCVLVEGVRQKLDFERNRSVQVAKHLLCPIITLPLLLVQYVREVNCRRAHRRSFLGGIRLSRGALGSGKEQRPCARNLSEIMRLLGVL